MAERLVQDIGDRLTTALISGRFDLYRSLMRLPLRIVPRDGAAYVLTTDAALEDDFNQYHAVIRAHGVTDIFRQLQKADLSDPQAVLLVCLTHIMVDAHRIVDPFETRFHLSQSPAGWLIHEIESSEGHIRWTLGHAAVLAGGQFGPTPQPDERERDAET